MTGNFLRALRTPFARPPGRRGLITRLAPELCALLVYGALVACYLLLREKFLSGQVPMLCGLLPPPSTLLAVTGVPVPPLGNFHFAAAMAAALAGLLIIFLPVGPAAATLAAERERGTLEALLLTPTHHHRLARGRFWLVTLPWLRFALYLLPVYLAFPFYERFLSGGHTAVVLGGLDGELRLSGPEIFDHGAAPWSMAWLKLLGGIFRADAWNEGFGYWLAHTIRADGAHGFLLPALRWAHDVSAGLFAAAVGFLISARAPTVRGALLYSYLLAPLALLTVLSPDVYWLFLSVLPMVGSAGGYWLVVLAMLVVRLLVIARLVARVADNLDAVALGELPEKPRAATRRPRSG